MLANVVMLSHFGALGAWSNADGVAVDAFFALSRWLIGGILLNTDRAGLPRFFFNRALRIWSSYYLALALLIGVSLLRDPVGAKWLEFVAYKA